MTTWRDLEARAPEIASLGQARLAETRIALLGTLRKDGSPRISPIEPYFSDGDVLFGAMAWSLKTRDLQRDPRCVVHSTVTGPNSGEPELKLYGRALEVPDDRRDVFAEGWWTESPREAAWVFSLVVEAATYVEWHYERGEMLVKRWSASRGYSESKRNYP